MKDGFVKVAAGTPAIRVADPMYNARVIADMMKDAAGQGVKVLCLPELCLTGATCGDLFFQETLLSAARKALEWIVEETAELDLVTALGMPLQGDNGVYNCAVIIQNRHIQAAIPRFHLPAEQRRWFTPGEQGGGSLTGMGWIMRCRQVPALSIGAALGDDPWAADATLVLHLTAQPELAGYAHYRRTQLRAYTAQGGWACVSAGAGEGESTSGAVYSGHDLIVENGVLLAERRWGNGLTVSEVDVAALAHDRRLRGLPILSGGEKSSFAFLSAEETVLTRSIPQNPFLPADPGEYTGRWEDILTTAAVGLKTRLERIGCPRPVLGLSGGLDSTLALLITVRAIDMLGKERSHILALTMPCFGTTSRTRSNAEILAERLGAEFRTVDISAAVEQHFRDIGQSMDNHDVTFENAQARERTQVLMDIANQVNGLVVGTGDLSELALGWCTYNGDQMSMYCVNADIPKTLVRRLTAHVADTCGDDKLAAALRDILDTPVSPELLPPKEGEIVQKTEDLVGPYELHDFFLYHLLRHGCPPAKLCRMAKYAFRGEYDDETILKWLKIFLKRFFTQQFKRQPSPDGPKVGSVSLAPRGDWVMPSDAAYAAWLAELEG